MRVTLVLAALLLGTFGLRAEAQGTRATNAPRTEPSATTVTTTRTTTAGTATTTTRVTNAPTRSRGPAPPSNGAARRAERREAVTANDLVAPYGTRGGDARREAPPNKREVRRATRRAERANRYGTRTLSAEESRSRADANRRPATVPPQPRRMVVIE